MPPSTEPDSLTPVEVNNWATHLLQRAIQFFAEQGGWGKVTITYRMYQDDTSDYEWKCSKQKQRKRKPK